MLLSLLDPKREKNQDGMLLNFAYYTGSENTRSLNMGIFFFSSQTPYYSFRVPTITWQFIFISRQLVILYFHKGHMYVKTRMHIELPVYNTS